MPLASDSLNIVIHFLVIHLVGRGSWSLCTNTSLLELRFEGILQPFRGFVIRNVAGSAMSLLVHESSIPCLTVR